MSGIRGDFEKVFVDTKPQITLSKTESKHIRQLMVWRKTAPKLLRYSPILVDVDKWIGEFFKEVLDNAWMYRVWGVKLNHKDEIVVELYVYATNCRVNVIVKEK